MKPKKTKSILACTLILCMVFGIQSNLAFVFAQENDDSIGQENITDYTTDMTNSIDTTGAIKDDTKDTDIAEKDVISTKPESEPMKLNRDIVPTNEIIPQADDNMSSGNDINKANTIQPSTDWYNEESEKFVLNTAEELVGLTTLANDGNTFAGKTIELGQNIDLQNIIWLPIKSFAGTFDGKNYTISNITISTEGAYAGFFGYLNKGTVKNLNLSTVTFSPSDAPIASVEGGGVGTLCGRVSFLGSKIDNCHVSQVTIESMESRNVGGLIGYIYSGESSGGKVLSISNCSVDYSSLTVTCDYLGGLIGMNNSYGCSIISCSVKNLSLTNNKDGWTWCGGISGYAVNPNGYSNCLVENSNISANNAGGFLGYVQWGGTLSKASVSNSTVTTLSENGKLAGLIGTQNANPVTISDSSLTNVTIRAKAQNQLNTLIGAGTLNNAECQQQNTQLYLNDTLTMTYTENGVEYLILTDTKTAIATGLSGELKNGLLEIPDFLEIENVQYAVTMIGSSAFNGKEEIKSLILGNQLTHISANAFKNCTNISGSLVIPSSVTTIEESAFLKCENITGITIGKGVTTIGKNAFRDCSNVTALNLGSNLKTIGEGAFANLTALSGTLVIPESVTSLIGNASYSGTGAFSNCKNVERIILTGENVSVGGNVFENIESLKVFIATSNSIFDKKAFTSTGTDSSNEIVFYLIGDTVPENILSLGIKAVTNGGSFAESTEFETSKLATPIKTGYYFDGWYENESFSGSPVTTYKAGQTYYAKWTEKTSTSISFKDDLDLNKIYDGSAVSLSENDYIVTEGAGKVTFNYQRKEDNEWKDIETTPINAGTYQVRAIVEENDTYKSAETDWKEFTISKATPTYEAPTNLTAIVGQTLADVTLPEGFAWQDDTTTSVGSAGINTFKVTYTPEDTANYKTTTDIEVTLTVNPKMEELNTIPTINASDKTLTVGDTFDPLKDVTASDKEDSDIAEKVEVLSNDVDTSKAGTYTVIYKVTDSKGASSTKTITITVNPKMEELNAIPTINASDKTLTVGDKFDPLKDVTASDKEDGDITEKVEVLCNDVDTSKAGTYKVIYKVTDSKGASSTKTITVTVKAKDTQKPTIDDNKKPSATDTDKNPASIDKQITTDSPKTSDSTNITTWAVLMFLSLGLLTGVFIVRKSRKSI